MEIQGKIHKILQLQSGQGKNGIWKKQEFVIETDGQISKKICLSLWGDKVEQFPLTEGEDVTVSFDIESREYNGKWYTDARAWKIVPGESKANQGGSSHKNTSGSIPASDDIGEQADDLPF